jgi:hypothetical protein
MFIEWGSVIFSAVFGLNRGWIVGPWLMLFVWVVLLGLHLLLLHLLLLMPWITVLSIILFSQQPLLKAHMDDIMRSFYLVAASFGIASG